MQNHEEKLGNPLKSGFHKVGIAYLERKGIEAVEKHYQLLLDTANVLNAFESIGAVSNTERELREVTLKRIRTLQDAFMEVHDHAISKT